MTRFLVVVTLIIMVGSMAIAEQCMKTNKTDLASGIELALLGY